MERKALFLATTVASVMFLSCSVRDLQETSSVRRTISRIEAVIDDNEITRVHLEGSGRMKWDMGDQIGVFSDAENPVRFRMEGGNFFVCDDGQSVSGQTFYAFYPYSDQVFQSDNRNVLSVTGGSAEGRNKPVFSLPMVAKSNGSSLSFKQTCGVLHFSLTGTGMLKSILLEANGGESIYGTGTIDLTEDTPVFKIGNGSPAFALTLANPVQLSKNNPYSVWFGLPPGTLGQGFTLTMEYEDGSVKKVTDKAVSIKRATLKNYTVDIDQIVEEAETALEREALIALYDAMDGPHWTNRTNWCSDKPLSEWYGVYLENGRVTVLDLEFNGLNGTLPTELSNLKSLKRLSLGEKVGRISNMEALFGLSALESLTFGVGESIMDFEDYKSRMFSVPSGIGNLKKLKYVYLTGINDDLPEEFFELEGLEQIYLRRFNTGRPLQSGFGKLKNLKILSINCIPDGIIPGLNPVCGELPDSIYDLDQLEALELVDTNVGGQLSPRIGELKNLNALKLPSNQFSGPLPAELSNLALMEKVSMRNRIDLHNNRFSGKIPEAFRNWPEWHQNWGYIISGNHLEFTEVMPLIPSFETTTIDGKRISSEMVKDQELTVLFQSASWCPFSPAIIDALKDIYPTYKDKGLEVFCYSSEDENTVKAFADSYGFSWPTFVNDYGPNGKLPPLGIDYYPINSIPSVTIFDRSGRLVYYQFGTDGSLTEFIESQLGDGVTELYESADYAADGTVHTLQTATSGAGIDIVLMGDGYSDRLIADGTYASVMQRATEAFFSEDPYKSFRDCFNVYYVDVVSKNERYTGETAFSTWYGSGTAVGGNDAKVIEYARKVIPDSRMDDATVIVLMNRDYYAGTCYMYPPAGGDYGSGLSVSYFPVSSFETTFSGLVSHEAGGHGFGKLADEYYYASNGTIPQSKIDEYISTAAYGWWRNGDFTSDPAAVKWSAFLNDGRYSAEGLGVYEGAFTYYYGAWRPTRNSIMNNNTGGFNAPSRYAIWYRIGKLAYGADWNGTYEDFVAWDAINRTSASHAPRKAQPNYVEKNFQPLAPPVVIHHSWRDQ